MPAQAPRATQEAPEGSSRQYMPYSVFRKLRLDSIRGALGLGEPFHILMKYPHRGSSCLGTKISHSMSLCYLRQWEKFCWDLSVLR